mgnify:CR=1 FL=1
MTDQEISQAWNDTDSRLQSIESHDSKTFDVRGSTALDNLARRYRMFSRLGLAMTLCSPVYALSNIIPDPWRYVLSICLCAFFRACRQHGLLALPRYEINRHKFHAGKRGSPQGYFLPPQASAIHCYTCAAGNRYIYTYGACV